jgi:NADH:ubiquinone reductase (non-electrogenic)
VGWFLQRQAAAARALPGQRTPYMMLDVQNRPGTKPTLVVLGTGFASLSLLKELDYRSYDVIVVSPRNHFLFTPLLPSTTVGTLEFRSIIEPIRQAVDPSACTYYQATCVAIDPATRIVTCEGAFDQERFLLTYHSLVVAVGSTNKTFGIPGVREYALFLKELSDARAIRQRIIECFERASTPMQTEEERRRLLHFVVVGGGPTGVEFAAELNDFLDEDLKNWFPEMMNDVRITLVDASNVLLNSFDEKLSEYTMRHFKRTRIEVRTRSLVKEVRPNEVVLADGQVIPHGLVVWSAGVGPAPLVETLPFPKDRGGRLLTDPLFAVDEAKRIYAIGDCATRAGDALPATAQVAQQEGEFLAKHLNRIARGKPAKEFKYRHMGMLAYIGDRRALADTKYIKGKGFTTWLFWRSAYVTKLVSLKNKILVLFDWFKTMLFGRDISRF